MVPLATTPTVFETMPDTMYLVETIASDATSMKINYVPLAMTSGVFIVDEGTTTEERISWNGAPTDNGDGTATFSDLGRGLGYGGGTAYAAAAETAYPHTGNSSTVRLVMAHEYLNKMMVTDRDNTILSGKKLFMGGSGVWVYGDATELYFRSTTTSEKTLSQLAALSGTDEKIKISNNDTTAGYANGKLVAGTNITLTEVNDGSNETLSINLSSSITTTISGQLGVTNSSELTIASGAVTATQTYHSIDTEGDAAGDDLITINGAAAGKTLMIRMENSARIVNIKDGDGNIIIPGGDITLIDPDTVLMFLADGTNWRLVSGRDGMVGDIRIQATEIVPTGWALAYGSTLNRTTYSNLFDKLVPTIGTFTVTIASPGVFTLNAHGQAAGDSIFFTTTGALPTGLSANTLYYIISTGLTANEFQVSATFGGSAINASGTQSGVHTAVKCPYGLGDGSTTFTLPDTRGRYPAGKDNMGGSSANRLTDAQADTIGQAAGVADGTHSHVTPTVGTGSQSGGVQVRGPADVVPSSTSNTSVVPPYFTTIYIIKV